MSKLNLRALNSHNTSTNAYHYDLNKKTLATSWKKIHSFLKILHIIKNQFLIFKNNNIYKNKKYVYLNKKYLHNFNVSKNKNNCIFNFKIMQINKKIIIIALKHNNINNTFTKKIIEKENYLYI